MTGVPAVESEKKDIVTVFKAKSRARLVLAALLLDATDGLKLAETIFTSSVNSNLSANDKSLVLAVTVPPNKVQEVSKEILLAKVPPTTALFLTTVLLMALVFQVPAEAKIVTVAAAPVPSPTMFTVAVV
ncbi:hypothetical protein D3C85_1280970 [compost metagenome]